MAARLFISTGVSRYLHKHCLVELCGQVVGVGCTAERADVQESAAGDVVTQVVVVITNHPLILIEDRSPSLIHTFGERAKG